MGRGDNLNPAEVPLALLTISALALLITYQYRPKKVSTGLQRAVKGAMRVVFLASIFGVTTYLGLHLLHFELTPEWTRSIIALTIGSMIAGAMANGLWEFVMGQLK